MAQGRGNARAILFAAAMLAVVQAVAAKDIIVGGSNKWDYPPGTDTTYYDTWAASTTFNVGDNLVFEYMAGAHDVQVVTQAQYAGCLMSSGERYTTGNDVIPLTKAGDHYFLCSFPSHCDSGMKVKITVKAASASPPPETPPSAVPPVATSPPATPPPATAPPATPPPATAPPATPPPATAPPLTPPPVAAPPAKPPVVAPIAPPVRAPAPAPVVRPPVPAPVKAPVPAPVEAPVPAPVEAPTPVPDTVPAPTPVPVKSPVAAPTPPVAEGPALAPAPAPGSSGHSLRVGLSVVGTAAVVAVGALLF